MDAILTTMQVPGEGPQYQAMIVRDDCWVVHIHDRQFCKETLAGKDLNWSVSDA